MVLRLIGEWRVEEAAVRCSAQLLGRKDDVETEIVRGHLLFPPGRLRGARRGATAC